MADLFELGVSALNANKASLVTTGHNISNANTAGYSRQETIQETPIPQRAAVGFLGSGVQMAGVRRIHDTFLTNELRVTASGFKQYEIIVENAEQLDNLLGDETTSLAPSLERFFAAMQDAADNPSSTATRQMLLSESGLLIGRFAAVQDRLDDQNTAINTQLETITTELSSLALGVAELNERIAVAGSQGQASAPNDLLDKRDELILRMSELVSVNTVEASDGSVSVFFGTGQGMVIGSRAFAVTAEPKPNDPTRYGIMFREGSANLDITNSIVGGQLGGLLNFRENILDATYNQLGLVAIGLNASVNEQHRRGMDLDNQLGADFFVDVNSTARMRNRFTADINNAAPADRVIEVEIEELENLQFSDYTLEFSTSNLNQYVVTRQNDGQVVAQSTFSGVFPSTVEFDGLTMRLVSGSFQAGDRFTLQPTRSGARELQMQVSSVRDVALAQPVRTIASVGNRGTGVVSQGVVLDTSTAAFDGANNALSPPVLIRFTSSTSYEVLDYSNPANPVELVPPMNNQTFVPGIENAVFSENEDENAVITDGTAIGIPVNTSGTNSYPAETLTVTTVDSVTGQISSQSITTLANDTAVTSAQALDALTGVSATASTYARISNIRSSSPMNLSFNGQLLAGTEPNTLADSINNNAVLTQQGISASSNGSELIVRSTQGVDFQFQVGGGAVGDSIDIAGPSGTQITVTGADALPEATVGGRVSMVLSEGVTIQGVGGLLSILPTHTPTFRGYQVHLSGNPVDGDEFVLEYNTDGFADNRNALALADLQLSNLLVGGNSSLQDTYSSLVNVVGTQTQESSVNMEAAEVLFARAQQERSEVSGVNLDEEAARLIEFELAYNAAAQLISVARGLFDTLLTAAS